MPTAALVRLARNGSADLGDEIETDAGVVGRARPRREHHRVRIHGDDLPDADLVVAKHADVRPQPAEIVEQVEGEAVVIVDQDDHGLPCPRKLLEAGLDGIKAGPVDRDARACRGHPRQSPCPLR